MAWVRSASRCSARSEAACSERRSRRSARASATDASTAPAATTTAGHTLAGSPLSARTSSVRPPASTSVRAPPSRSPATRTPASNTATSIAGSSVVVDRVEHVFDRERAAQVPDDVTPRTAEGHDAHVAHAPGPAERERWAQARHVALGGRTRRLRAEGVAEDVQPVARHDRRVVELDGRDRGVQGTPRRRHERARPGRCRRSGTPGPPRTGRARRR